MTFSSALASTLVGPLSVVRELTAVRYVTPLREGGSLPAIVEADDGRLYVIKFRGAGQGTRALAAELITALVARAVGLPVPEPVRVIIEPPFARSEPDEEIADLLHASIGRNFGLAYLPGAATFTRGADPPPDERLASAIVWLDGYLMNVDRTVRNPNLLVAGGELVLIDHGAALYWHHDWSADTDRSGDRFALIRDHVLLPWAGALPEVAATLATRLDDAAIEAAVRWLPDDWLAGPFDTPDAHRAGYAAFLRQRRDRAKVFVEEAMHARAKFV